MQADGDARTGLDPDAATSRGPERAAAQACVLQHRQQVGFMDVPALQMTVAGTAEAVRHALRDILADRIFAPYSADLAINAEIALAEVLNNIVEHAYAQRSGDIQIILLRGNRGLECRLADRGAAMPGLSLPEGAFQTLGEIADLPEGGFGWFLIRSLVQDLCYARVNDENRLSFLLVDEQSALC